MAWDKLLKRDPRLSLRRLAEQLGEVPPTLVRYGKLIKLLPEIRVFLGQLADPRAIHYFSIRRLMPLAGLTEAQQHRQFRELQVEYGKLAGRKNEEATREVMPNRPGIRPG